VISHRGEGSRVGGAVKAKAGALGPRGAYLRAATSSFWWR
jgi:hypothetical protein